MIKYILHKPNNDRFYNYIAKFNFHKSNNVVIVPTNVQLNDNEDYEYSNILSQILNAHIGTFNYICFQLKPITS